MKFLKNIIYFCILIILSLSSCKPPNPFINLQTKVINKKESTKKFPEEKNVEIEKKNKISKRTEKTKFKKKPIKEKANKKENLINLENFLEKDILSITKVFGNPNLIIKHNKIKNFQYHFQSCFLDLFFVSSGNDYILKHLETRSSELNRSYNEKICFKEISNLINK